MKPAPLTITVRLPPARIRLAAECLAGAERSGLPTARAGATRSAAQLPFGAFAALLPVGDNSQGGPTRYWLLGATGKVHAFGDAAHHGDASVWAAAQDVDPTPSGNGYWVLDAIGRVHTFGDAAHHGHGPPAACPSGGDGCDYSASLSSTPTGGGYWIFSNRGGVSAYGDAVHHGDVAAIALNGPVLDSVATPSGKGYYMVASDGGVFTFGDPSPSTAPWAGTRRRTPSSPWSLAPQGADG